MELAYNLMGQVYQQKLFVLEMKKHYGGQVRLEKNITSMLRALIKESGRTITQEANYQLRQILLTKKAP